MWLAGCVRCQELDYPGTKGGARGRGERGRREMEVGGMDLEDCVLLVDLMTKTNIGPNDELVNRHNGKAYSISSIRYSGAGWQTAVFDRTRFLWLYRPMFRVNEMENGVRAVRNHFTTIVVVAESAPGLWPKGMIWTEPSETCWSEAQRKVLSEFPNEWEPEKIVNFYSSLRKRYNCVRPVR